MDAPGKSGFQIYTTGDHLNRAANSVKSARRALRKKDTASLFRQYYESVGLFEKPFFDTLNRAKQKTILTPDPGVGIFLGHKTADVKKQLWLMTRKLPPGPPLA